MILPLIKSDKNDNEDNRNSLNFFKIRSEKKGRQIFLTNRRCKYIVYKFLQTCHFWSHLAGMIEENRYFKVAKWFEV